MHLCTRTGTGDTFYSSYRAELAAPTRAMSGGVEASEAADGLVRTLGTGDAALRVSAQGFGCMGITAFYGQPMRDDDAVALLCHAFRSGVTHWDTAEVYQAKDEAGETLFNEAVVGKAIAAVGQRESLQIATTEHQRG